MTYCKVCFCSVLAVSIFWLCTLYERLVGQLASPDNEADEYEDKKHKDDRTMPFFHGVASRGLAWITSRFLAVTNGVHV